MNTIYKYELEVTDRQAVLLPPNASILSVQVQDDIICLWVGLDPDELPLAEPRDIRIHGTGHPVSESLLFIGTVQLSGGSLVFQVFEVLERYNEVNDLRLN